MIEVGGRDGDGYGVMETEKDPETEMRLEIPVETETDGGVVGGEKVTETGKIQRCRQRNKEGETR